MQIELDINGSRVETSPDTWVANSVRAQNEYHSNPYHADNDHFAFKILVIAEKKAAEMFKKSAL